MPAPERTLVVWCPDWAVAAAGHPGTVPVAVVHANRVVACSAAARADGVRRGLRRREAQGRCPDRWSWWSTIPAGTPGCSSRWWRPSRRSPRGRGGAAGGGRHGHPGAVPVLRWRPRPGRPGGGHGRRRPGPPVRSRLPGGCGRRLFAAELAGRAGRCRRGDAIARSSPGDDRHVPVPPCRSRCSTGRNWSTCWPGLGLRILGRSGRPAGGRRAGPVRAPTGPWPTGWPGASTNGRSRCVSRPRSGRRRRARPAGRAGRRGRLHGQGPGRPAARAAGGAGLACTRVAIEAETEHGEHLRRLWRHDGRVDGRRHRRPGALAARRLARRSGATTAGLTLLRLVPDEVSGRPRAPARVLGRRRPRPTTGPPGPWPGSRACSAPRGSSPPWWAAVAIRPIRSGWCRGVTPGSRLARSAHRPARAEPCAAARPLPGPADHGCGGRRDPSVARAAAGTGPRRRAPPAPGRRGARRRRRRR